MSALIDLGAVTVINGIAPRQPTDYSYEYRCLAFDAERAFKLGEPIEKACSWGSGTKQRNYWLAAYKAAKEAS